MANHAILISNLLGPPSSSKPRWIWGLIGVWLILEWGSHQSNGCSFLGTLLLPNWCQNWVWGHNTGAFKVTSLNSVQGVDGAGLLTASQCSLVAPWGGEGLLAMQGVPPVGRRVGVGLLQHPTALGQLAVLERASVYCVQCMRFYREQVAWPVTSGSTL